MTAIVLFASCGSSKKTEYPEMNAHFPGRVNAFTFASQTSDTLYLSEQGAKAVNDAITQTKAEYEYESMYELEEVKSRLDFDASVDSHEHSVLDAQGVLSASHFASLVKQNNESFMATKPFGYEVTEDEYIDKLCEFIVQVIAEMTKKYPDLDWPRVYCNLGNLKILYDVGMLSYAQVTEEMILKLSQNNTTILLNMQGNKSFSQVLTHEVMHIIQIGCTCENFEDGCRRAGIAMYWDDFTLNTTDWSWLAEGSAERHMCNLTGLGAVSYQYKMDYICSLNLSVLLRDSVQADTIETLCFYDDTELLFDAFGCQTQEQRDEVLKMMITLQVLQMQPNAFHRAYTEQTGVDLTADDEAMNQFSYSLKPAVCITLAKEFYENLVAFMQTNPLPANDLFFLINLFEGHLHQHLSFNSESKKECNEPFFTAYATLRNALFEALADSNNGLDIAGLYDAYDITAAGEKQLNADLGMLSEEKRTFLAERAQWQSENLGLGQKAPK